MCHMQYECKQQIDKLKTEQMCVVCEKTYSIEEFTRKQFSKDLTSRKYVTCSTNANKTIDKVKREQM